jgi:hypothetical protein
MKNTSVALSNEPSHTLAELQSSVGTPDTALDEAFFHGASDAELIAQGQRIATPRVLTDARRIYPTAFDFWTQANEGQRSRLRGFSLPLLAIAVGHALTLQGMLDDHTTRTETNGTNREGREREAKEAFDTALLLRDQGLSVFRTIVAGDHDLGAEVESAMGTADSPENLAKALKKLAAVGTHVLALKKSPLATRARLMQVDAAYVEQLTAAGDRLATAAEKTRARSGGGRVSQGMLDREDGANLLLLGHVIDVFEAAHDIDPSIPRLVPIATRRLLGRTRRAAAADKAPPADKASPADKAAPAGAPVSAAAPNGN